MGKQTIIVVSCRKRFKILSCARPGLCLVRGLTCKPNIYVSWSTSELRMRLVLWNKLKPSNKIFLLSILLWIICVIYVLCLSCFRVCSLLPCGLLLGKGWPLGSRLWCLIVFLSLSHVVSWVRCGTWLYWFLIFATFLTLPGLKPQHHFLVNRTANLKHASFVSGATPIMPVIGWGDIFLGYGPLWWALIMFFSYYN